MNRLVLTAGGLAAGLALLLTSCGSGDDPSTNGPFGNSNARSRFGECLPALFRGEVATMAAESFPNSGGPARIQGVTLVDPHDLRLVAAWVVPITGTDLMGVFQGYPPYGAEGKNGFPGVVPGVQWALRQRADGAVVQHTPGQDEINLVLVVQASGFKGTSKDVLVDYESAGTRYRLDVHFSMVLYNEPGKWCLTDTGA